MKRKLFFFFAVALCMTMALPTKAQTDDSVAAQEAVSKKTLPYPRATKAVPASAMEYDSIAGCFVVRDTIAPSRAAARFGATSVVTRAAVAYTEAGVKYGYFGDQLSSDEQTAGFVLKNSEDLTVFDQEQEDDHECTCGHHHHHCGGHHHG